jgi:hypothetical protein
MGQLSFGTFQVSALNTGTGGNNISIIFQLGGVGVSAIKTGNTITVSHPGTITVSQLHTALSSVATGLIAVGAISGNGSLSFSPLPNSGNLSGGTNAVTAETTAVIVGGGDLNATSITVRIAAAETDIAVVVSVVNDAATSVTASGTGSIGAKTDSVALIGGSD